MPAMCAAWGVTNRSTCAPVHVGCQTDRQHVVHTKLTAITAMCPTGRDLAEVQGVTKVTGHLYHRV